MREQVFVNGVRLILKAKVDSGKEAEATQRTAAQAAQQSGESGGAQQHRQPPESGTEGQATHALVQEDALFRVAPGGHRPTAPKKD